MNQNPGLNPPTLISEYEIRDAIVKNGVYLMRDISKIKNAINLVNHHLFKKYKHNVVLSIVEENVKYDSLNLTGYRNAPDLYCVKYNINILVCSMVEESRMSLIKYIKDVFRWIGVYLEEPLFAMTASTSSNIFYQSLHNEKITDGPITINTGFFITSSLFIKKVEVEKENYYFDYVNSNVRQNKNMLDKIIDYFK